VKCKTTGCLAAGETTRHTRCQEVHKTRRPPQQQRLEWTLSREERELPAVDALGQLPLSFCNGGHRKAYEGRLRAGCGNGPRRLNLWRRRCGNQQRQAQFGSAPVLSADSVGVPAESEPPLVAAMAAPEVHPAVAAPAPGAEPSFIGFAMAAISKRRRKSSEHVDSGQLPLFAA